MKTKEERIRQLLGMAFKTKSSARSHAIANQILEIDSQIPEALLIKADCTENDKERSEVLIKALEAIDAHGCVNDSDNDLFRLVLNQRLAFTLFALNNFDGAFTACEKVFSILEADDSLSEDFDGYNVTKDLYYRIMLARKEWQKILAETMQDSEHSAGWAYSRLIAAYMLAPGKNKKSLCAKMFWDALIISPQIPFYMLGYAPEPDDNASSKDFDDFNFALMYYDVLSVSDDFFHWFSRGVILFGLLTNRFDAKERDYMIDVIDSLGGYEEYEHMNNIIMERDDTAVIEALAAHKCLTR